MERDLPVFMMVGSKRCWRMELPILHVKREELLEVSDIAFRIAAAGPAVVACST